MQFGQVMPEMGRTENLKMPDFGNQPSKGLSGVLMTCVVHAAMCHPSITQIDKEDTAA